MVTCRGLGRTRKESTDVARLGADGRLDRRGLRRESRAGCRAIGAVVLGTELDESELEGMAIGRRPVR